MRAFGRSVKRRLWFYGVILALLAAGALYATSMPGASYTGALPAPTSAQRELAARLREHVTQLAGSVGVRTVDREGSLERARRYLSEVLAPLASAGARVQLEDVGSAGRHAQNVIFEVPGTATASIVLVGAHYDSIDTGPGANDNASGVAVTLELAKRFATAPAACSVRFVLFANEEPPYFKNPGMGSLVNATRARERGDPIVAMLSLETIGHYSDASGSQHYPWPVGLLYPSRGNFLGFVGNLGSRSLLRSAIGSFRRAAAFPSEGAALPTTFPGVDWSDHWAFWQAGYPAIMITDTAPYRDPNYHRASDTPDQLDYDSLARVTEGLTVTVRDLARE